MDFGHNAVANGPIRRGGLPDGSEPASFHSPTAARTEWEVGSVGRFQQSFGARIRDGERAGFTNVALSEFEIVPGRGELPVLGKKDLLKKGKSLPQNGGREGFAPFP